MLKKIFSTTPLWLDGGLACIRFITGAMMIYHGWEVFDAVKMDGYRKWLSDLNFPAHAFMAYLGKGSEFVGGILLLLGWFTRLAAIVIAITMTIVSFGMGHGKILTDDQHPFLFVVLAIAFFFTGPGKYSIDKLMQRGKN